MTKYGLDDPLPKFIRPPLRFREKGGRFEGEVEHPREIIAMFEPVDVLSGAMELVDRLDRLILIHSVDDGPVKRNEYPTDVEKLYYRSPTERELVGY